MNFLKNDDKNPDDSDPIYSTYKGFTALIMRFLTLHNYYYDAIFEIREFKISILDIHSLDIRLACRYMLANLVRIILEIRLSLPPECALHGLGLIQSYGKV